MIRVLSASTKVLYRHVAKPLLFRVPPDTVHDQLLKAGKTVQRSAFLRSMVNTLWAYQNEPKLTQTIHGITFANPVGLSAGFDKNIVLPPLMQAVGFGFMEGGSVTLQECAGNPKPWFYRLPKTKSLVVHAGLANNGAKLIAKRLLTLEHEGFPLNISVAKTNSPQTCADVEAIADYVGSLRHLRKVGDMFTVNISCPNTYGGEPFTSPDRLEKLLAAVDKVKLHQPVFIKMPSHLSWPEFNALLKVIDRHKIQGVTIGNLAKDRSKIKLADSLPAHVKGGLSGLPTQAATDELVRQTYLAYPGRFTIIGVGGIFSAEDAYRKIQLGANLVELITGMIFEGPQLIGQINRGLTELLEYDGYQHISEAVGTAARK